MNRQKLLLSIIGAAGVAVAVIMIGVVIQSGDRSANDDTSVLGQADGSGAPAASPTLVPPTATLTAFPPIVTPTSGPSGDDRSALLPEDGPDPYFPEDRYSEGYSYNPFGTITGVRIGTEVRNRGGPGKVFVTVTCPNRDWRSYRVFDMRNGETVTVTAHFGVVTSSFYCEFEWTTRAALLSDISERKIEVGWK